MKDLKSYAQALAQYHLHPESKFLGGDFVETGVMHRRHVIAIGFRHIGKEADRIEGKQHQALDGSTNIDYGVAENDWRQQVKQFRNQERKIPITEIGRRTGLSTKHISNVIKGKKLGSTASRSVILAALRKWHEN